MTSHRHEKPTYEWLARFGDRLGARMQHLGIGQVELGRLVGCSQSTISKWRCSHGIPSSYSARRLALALQMPVQDLLPEVRL